VRTEIIQTMAGAAILSAVTYVPILAENNLGGDDIYVAFLVGMYALASFFSSYIFGRAGDIYGRRIVLRIGIVFSLMTFALLVFSNSLAMLFYVRLLNGFCIGIYPGALTAYAYESNMRMGKFASFGALGWGIGTAAAGYAAVFNIYYAFAVSTAFFLLAFASAFTLPKIQVTSIKVPLFPVRTFKRNYPVYLSVLIRHSSAVAVWTYWPLILVNLGADVLTVGLIQTTNSIVQVIFMWGLTDRFDCSKLVATGLIASAGTFLWIGLAQNIWEMYLAQIVVGFAWSCLYVGALKYVTERNIERATASGLLQSILSIAGVAGPIIAAIIFALGGDYYTVIYFAAVMALLSFAMFQFTNRNAECNTLEREPIEIIVDSEADIDGDWT
jgi:MFS family permease